MWRRRNRMWQWICWESDSQFRGKVTCQRSATFIFCILNILNQYCPNIRLAERTKLLPLRWLASTMSKIDLNFRIILNLEFGILNPLALR